jgi:hypothetical protein
VSSARSANDEDEDAAHLPLSSPPRTELRESDSGDGGNLMATSVSVCVFVYVWMLLRMYDWLAN